MSVVHASATSRVVRDGAAFREDEVATAKTAARMAMLTIAPRPHHSAAFLRRCGCFGRRPERFCCVDMLLDRLILALRVDYPCVISRYQRCAERCRVDDAQRALTSGAATLLRAASAR